MLVVYVIFSFKPEHRLYFRSLFLDWLWVQDVAVELLLHAVWNQVYKFKFGSPRLRCNCWPFSEFGKIK
ncbi:hypothetical protein ACMD2_11567 [Ananas comosus]|uniref:Uncharacterized protein n=1 Tax=Ananas comosus TaxID=4615 RepID=A0A199UED2_ANACO|nr:hypothetical protein ACMD2_11567 [Ananas comosus]